MSVLFGAYDENLRQLESLLNVRVRTQGDELLVEGDPTNTAKVVRLVELPMDLQHLVYFAFLIFD